MRSSSRTESVGENPTRRSPPCPGHHASLKRSGPWTRAEQARLSGELEALKLQVKAKETELVASQLALAEDPPANPPQDDDAWFFGDELEGDEDRITRLIAQVMVQTRTLFDELGVDATSVQRAELARREISRLSESRAAIFDEAAADEGG